MGVLTQMGEHTSTVAVLPWLDSAHIKPDLLLAGRATMRQVLPLEAWL